MRDQLNPWPLLLVVIVGALLSCGQGEEPPQPPPPAQVGQQVPGQQVPGQQVPGQQVPGQQVPGQQVPGQQVPGQQVPGQQAPAGNALAVGRPVTGAFAPGLPTDPTGKPFIDYQLTIAAPGNYQINLVSTNTTIYDPYLRLLQGANEITQDDDSGGSLQARITQALQPGVYTVRVTRFGAGQVPSPVPFTLVVSPAAG